MYQGDRIIERQGYGVWRGQRWRGGEMRSRGKRVKSGRAVETRGCRVRVLLGVPGSACTSQEVPVCLVGTEREATEDGDRDSGR